ncbi:putative ABC transport system permease protein [Nonomuraea polychroma]|uniref:Putative ABC transport system permease protein n=1 Tax=Nonomuraea polychroma TaxID=46176 RepID=A0A438ME92_9ACTN|nr:FtsX-like permease family protein [Nonomuraea polychroma]RVX44072.1 putative ABC transport system permease protein [Nonomuraea polychroma]
MKDRSARLHDGFSGRERLSDAMPAQRSRMEGAGAVWRVAVAAVRRRRFQSTVLGVVVLCSTVAIVVALGLLEASSAPFDRTFAAQRGPHAVAAFDRATVSDDELTRTAGHPAVEAVAGPFGQAVITVVDTGNLPPGPLTVVGRADPGGPVDRVNLWAGRWATGPGQIVLDRSPEPLFRDLLGSTVQVRGGPELTIVGLASSVSRTAEAWVAPGQMPALRPTVTQMLYRFTDPDGDLRAAVATSTSGLPAGSLLDWQSYLTVKEDVARTASAYLPFLTGFGVLGLTVAVLIVANVVGGAVVAGRRHIGVLKSLGFTPNQVVAVYLAMVLLPGFAGCLIGTGLGALAARPLLDLVFQGLGAAIGLGVAVWVYVAALLGVPAVVVLAALVPASRAHRLSAAETISAGSAPRSARGRRVQRLLAGARLPRAVGLGLGLPFARPGRSALTLATIVLGVTTVTLASGLFRTMVAYSDVAQRAGHIHTVVHVGRPDQTRPRHDDAGIEALLRSLPGTRHVIADAWIDVHLAGRSDRIMAQFLRGDLASRGDTFVRGRALSGPGEVVAPSAFMNKRGLRIGDRLTLEVAGARTTATIVGEAMDAAADLIMVSWPTLAALDPGQRATQYEVQLAEGTDVKAYNAAVKAADPGLYPVPKSQVDDNSVAIISATSIFTLLLGAVAALGVFNTVVLNTRERRRDLGVLKSIGMTPRQVTVMMVTSMAALGATGGLLGLPLGVAAHRLVVDTMFAAVGLTAPALMLDVWRIPMLAALVPAGVAIAMLGAFLPARSAARLTIAEALRTE